MGRVADLRATLARTPEGHEHQRLTRDIAELDARIRIRLEAMRGSDR